MTSLGRFPLAPDLPICRILNGMWQVSGAHGRIDRENWVGQAKILAAGGDVGKKPGESHPDRH